jgi:hypothetical protein
MRWLIALVLLASCAPPIVTRTERVETRTVVPTPSVVVPPPTVVTAPPTNY